MSGWRKRQIENLKDEEVKMKRLTINGLTAVLVSPGFGAGWSTWNPEVPEILFDPDIAKLVDEGASVEQIVDVALEKYPTAYLGGAEDLIVEWVPVGSQFRISEYDGSETLECRDAMQWFSA